MNKNKIIISGTGCALVDYLYTGVKFDSPNFQKYKSKQSGDGGLIAGNLVFTEELEEFSGLPYPTILKELSGNKNPDAFNLGGPALVSLINASQLLDKNDFEVCYYGGAGNDQAADLILQLAGKTPLSISNYKKTGNKTTPFTHVFSDPGYDNNQGERSFINNIGAAWDYSPELLDDNFFKANIACFGGTALVPQIHDNLTELLAKAKANNCITVVNTVFDFRNEKKNPDQPWPLGNTLKSYKLIDLLIMDSEEVKKISGCKTIEEAALHFADHNLSAFIITNGAKELFAFSNGSLFQKTDLFTLPVSNKIADDIISNQDLKCDTTGCGDNFAGGAIASLAWQLKSSRNDKLDLLDAISWAVASGGFACFYVGGTYFEDASFEKLSKIEKYKNDYSKQISK